jgi:uncharacterized protein (UPF0335 family)
MSISTTESRELLKSYIERIERVVEAIDDLKDDQKVLFAEAKANGFDTKSMRRIIKRRQKDQSELAECETIDDLYMHALGMSADHPLHVQVKRLVQDGVAREQVIEALQLLIPVNGEIIASVGGAPMRLWRTADGQPRSEEYVPPLLEDFMNSRRKAS